MYEKLKYWLSFLYHNAKKEFLDRPIATSAVLVGTIGILFPLLLSESLRGFVLYLLSKIFQPKIEASLLPLTIAAIALVVAFIPSIKNKQKKNYYFIEYDDYTWKVNITSMGHRIDSAPHCKEHQTRMVSTTNDLYICPICGSPGAKKLPYKRLSTLRELVQNLADAKEDEHLKE